MRKTFLDKYDYPANGYTSFWIAEILPVAFRDAGNVALSCFNAVASGTMNTKGTLSWSSRELEYSDKYWQCMTNLDGDGKLWVVELSIRLSDKAPVLFAYDPVNGAKHKTFSMEMPGSSTGLAARSMPVACDVNGDGKDEIIVSDSSGIQCIGLADGKTSALWKYPVTGCGPAVIADVDSNGFVEVIFATQSGKIGIIGK